MTTHHPFDPDAPSGAAVVYALAACLLAALLLAALAWRWVG